MTTVHLEANIKALRSKLRRVPGCARTAQHQIAVRHAGLALLLVHKNRAVAHEHYQVANLAAQPYLV